MLYIVISNSSNMPCVLELDDDGEEILVGDTNATCFDSHEEAEEAIVKSIEYGEEHSYFWAGPGFRIVTVNT